MRTQFLMGIVLLLLGACSTITQGNTQTITVVTDPSGAECTLSRQSEGIVAVVNPTPGSVMVEKDKDALIIHCKKEGFEEFEISTDSKFEGMTFGNIIFGGIIGVGIDAASGAMHEYPSNIVIPLKPLDGGDKGDKE